MGKNEYYSTRSDEPGILFGRSTFQYRHIEALKGIISGKLIAKPALMPVFLFF